MPKKKFKTLQEIVSAYRKETQKLANKYGCEIQMKFNDHNWVTLAKPAESRKKEARKPQFQKSCSNCKRGPFPCMDITLCKTSKWEPEFDY